uniref:Uncharacterized protein n=1 Tax=Plectus sambesii TaxID=2011161 RepID=A0A914UUV0_9BILA
MFNANKFLVIGSLFTALLAQAAYQHGSKNGLFFRDDKVIAYNFDNRKLEVNSTMFKLFDQLADYWPKDLDCCIDAVLTVGDFIFFFKDDVYYILDKGNSDESGRYRLTGPNLIFNDWNVKYVQSAGWFQAEGSDYARPTLIDDYDYYYQYSIDKNTAQVTTTSSGSLENLAYFYRLPSYFRSGGWDASIYRTDRSRRLLTIFKGKKYVELDYNDNRNVYAYNIKELSYGYGILSNKIDAACYG